MNNINPTHYKSESGEVWEKMIKAYGLEKFLAFCELNAFKYRMRAGKKHDRITEDIQKAIWYEKKIEELTEK